VVCVKHLNAPLQMVDRDATRPFWKSEEAMLYLEGRFFLKLVQSSMMPNEPRAIVSAAVAGKLEDDRIC
jgi:hypothetical protein